MAQIDNAHASSWMCQHVSACIHDRLAKQIMAAQEVGHRALPLPSDVVRMSKSLCVCGCVGGWVSAQYKVWLV
jgi:hypothetical protein